MYVLPGFVDVHGHNGDADKAPNPEYGYKLWLAHGVTSVRGVSFDFGGWPRTRDDRARSAANRIVAPRMFPYLTLGDGWTNGRVDSPAKAREWVRWAKGAGVDGIKFFNRDGETPAIIAAAIEEAKLAGLGTVAHLAQPGLAELNGRQAGALGLGTITHFYGHLDSLLKDSRTQAYPPGYNFNNEQDRFAEVASIADHIVTPGSPEWQDYLSAQLEAGVAFDPTFNIYSASRDLMRARNADWQADYTLPSMWDYFQSSRVNHGSYFFDWTTANEVAWKRFYQPFMRLVNDYKNMGGRVTTGSDPGFIFQIWGFAYIQELEMLQEAGFHPLEVISAATINGARTIYDPKKQEPPFGLVRAGMLADLVIVPENPLANLKTLYGTGHLRLNPQTDKLERVGGVKWTIKDGVVYDAQALLADVRRMVAEQKAARR
ncbi:amidohydrolase family protein [Sphingomonas sp. 1P06PA]|uniref:amidohydrolase family protein n=1 Tax=Sphingomonas sp. 1P06PA TaxID=554121 RepID=UPI0039A6957D